MKIIFLGTRGYIDARTRRHHNHASTLFEYKGTRIMFDRGLDWLDKPFETIPDALFITHAHPDHAWGLQHGVDVPVYASSQTWHILSSFAIDKRYKHTAIDRTPIRIGSMIIEPFTVVHSIRAPATGYRITTGNKTIFYSGDIVYIPQRHDALQGVDLYIGDGASITRPLVRQKNGILFGHAPISTQLSWCAKEGVSHAIFTHCGSQIVQADGRTINAHMRALAAKYQVQVRIAYDGLRIQI